MLGGQYTSRYEQLQLLGRSIEDQSQLFLVRDSISNEYRMAKKLSLFDSSSQEEMLLNEVTVLKELSHPHILRYYDIHLEGDTLVSVLEFCEQGDLSSYLGKKRARKEWFSEKLVLTWLIQLLMGLEYIHTRHIIHRLLSAKNVYLNHQGDLKLGSFGSAKVLENTLKKAMTVVTAPCNMSPEMVKGQPYNSKADIWALGCLIYEISALKPLYQYTNLPQLYDLIVEKQSPDLPVKYGKYLTPIYRKMMKKNPSQRPSASQLLQEQVFVGLMREYVRKKKIDSLDLKYIVPKRLAIHKTKQQKKEKVKLPPISPNPSGKTIVMKKQLKSEESRPFSKEKKKEVTQEYAESPKLVEAEEVTQRLTKIDEKQGTNISQLYEKRLALIQLKYKPNMDQINQKTFQFEDLYE